MDSQCSSLRIIVSVHEVATATVDGIYSRAMSNYTHQTVSCRQINVEGRPILSSSHACRVPANLIGEPLGHPNPLAHPL